MGEKSGKGRKVIKINIKVGRWWIGGSGDGVVNTEIKGRYHINSYQLIYSVLTLTHRPAPAIAFQLMRTSTRRRRARSRKTTNDPIRSLRVQRWVDQCHLNSGESVGTVGSTRSHGRGLHLLVSYFAPIHTTGHIASRLEINQNQGVRARTTGASVRLWRVDKRAVRAPRRALPFVNSGPPRYMPR